MRTLSRKLRIFCRVGAISLLVLLLAQTFAVDHWPGVQVMHEASESQDHVHTQHCHINIASCSDAPVSSGPGQFLTSEEWLSTTPLQSTAIIELPAQTITSVSVIPQIPPPRASAI
jgi:hypothetical protein